MGKGSFELPVEVVQVTAVILPGAGVKCIKNATFVKGKDGMNLEIEYVTKFGGEEKFWLNADDFMGSVKEAVARGKEPRYVFNHLVELVPLE